MKRVFFALLILSSSFYILLSCSSSESKGPPKEPSLRISPRIQKYFVPFEKEIYTREEIPGLLSSMKKGSDLYCSMIMGGRRYDRQQATTYIAAEEIDHFKKMSHGYVVYQLMAGCWNFFTMNDAWPERDFDLVGKLYKDASFDCYSVGFLQPYYMHNRLACKSLTMLDIDWRILDAHHQLYQLYTQGLLGNDDTLDEAVAKLKLGWIAYGDNRGPDRAASIEDLCPKFQRERCRKEMLKFQDTMSSLNGNITWQVAALHDGTYSLSSEKNTMVIFLSNAVEKIYISRKEFHTLMERVNSALPEGGKALFIYHVGGRSQKGLYEMTRKGEEYAMKTICRDPYWSSTVNNKEARLYTTWFEEISTSRTVPTCEAMAEKLKAADTTGNGGEQQIQ